MGILATGLVCAGAVFQRRKNCTSCDPPHTGFRIVLSSEGAGARLVNNRKLKGGDCVGWGGNYYASRRERRVVVCAASRESLYETLGVSPSASEKDIKQAYRRLALKYHPDVNKRADAQEQFLRIKTAYQTLVDGRSRAKYDASLRPKTGDWEPFQRTSPSRARERTQEQEEFYGLEDFFKDLQSDLSKREASMSSQAKPKSLWEELADIGEEFVEFLEKELNISEASEDEKQGGDFSGDANSDGRRQRSKLYDDSSKTSSWEAPSDEKSKVEKDIAEIEDMLAQLKKELGI